MKDLKNEIWKDIPNYVGLYQASNLGRIKSLRKNIKILKEGESRGYKVVTLSNKSVRKNFYVHRLILSTFVPNVYNKEQINHINGNRYDNRLENLEWCTMKENLEHSILNKLYLKHKTRAKKVNQYDLENNFIRTWDSQTLASQYYNIPIGEISQCCSGKRKYAKGFIWKNMEE